MAELNIDVKNIRICKVLSVDDENGGDRIKVRILPEDNKLTLKQLPDCIPFIPKMFFVKPKVGEAVIVITLDKSSYSQRFYIGPIISQLNHMEYDSYDISALSLFQSPYIGPGVSENLKPKTKGCYPKDEDVAIMGRKYSDIILTDDDLKIRVGVRNQNNANPEDIEFNDKNGAFIKLKYFEDEQHADNDNYNSVATVVADKVLLLGNSPKDGNVVIADRNDLITDEKIKELIEKTHELPYGDKLAEFLIMFKNAFINHVHPFPTMPPCYTEEIKNLNNYNIDEILSNSIRIN